MKFTTSQLRGMRARLGTQESFAAYVRVSGGTVVRSGSGDAPGWYHYALIGAALELGMIETEISPETALHAGVSALRRRIGPMRTVADAFGLTLHRAYEWERRRSHRTDRRFRLAVLALALEQGHLGLATPNPYQFAEANDGYERPNGRSRNEKEPDRCGQALNRDEPKTRESRKFGRRQHTENTRQRMEKSACLGT